MKHGQSKFGPEEKPLLESKKELDQLVYMSDEYKAALENVQEAVLHHYRHNRHHPEYHGGIENMNLIDLLEMLADWKAASEMQGSTIAEFLIQNRDRFKIPYQIYNLLENTCIDLGWME